MNILLVTPSYFPSIGGSEVLTKTLSDRLVESGFNVDIMTLNIDEKRNSQWRNEEINECSLNLFKVAAVGFPKNFPNPLSLLRINVLPNPVFLGKLKDYDIIHFIGEADLGLPILSIFIKKPKIMQCVGIFAEGGIYHYYVHKRPFLRKTFAKIFSKVADVFVTYSSEEKNLLSELGVPKNKISTLPLGVDTKVFRKGNGRKADNLVLFVGRIDRIKGLHLLLEALQYVRTPIQLVIIGPKWNEKYYREIEQMSEEINGNGFHRVNLLGSLPHKDLINWYQKAATLVTPYLYETFSYVTLEALACETPVVSTGTHFLKDYPDGLIVTSANPKSIARAVEKLLLNHELREKYGLYGRKLVENFFSWESVIEKLKKIYLDLAYRKIQL